MGKKEIKQKEYKEFELAPRTKDHLGWLSQNLVIRELKKEEKGKSLEHEITHIIYNSNTGEIIGTVEANGKIKFDSNYINKIKESAPDLYDSLGLEKREIYLNELPEGRGYMTSSGRKLDEEELELAQGEYNKQKEISEENRKEEEKKEYKEPKTVDKENEEIEEDLELEKGAILYSAKIRDEKFTQTVPGLNRCKDSLKFIFVKGKGPMIVGKSKDGSTSYEPIPEISPAKSTSKRAVTITKDGNKVKEEAILGEFEIEGFEREYSLGWVIGSGGYPELRTLRYNTRPDNLMQSHLVLAAPVETNVERPISKDVRDMMNPKLNKDVAEELKKYVETNNKGNITVNDLKDDNEKEESEEEKKGQEEIEEDEGRVPWERFDPRW